MDAQDGTSVSPPDPVDPEEHPGKAGTAVGPLDDDDEDELEPPLLPYVSWPPPGLERIQGDLWGVTAQLAVGGGIFTLPLLAAATFDQDFWSLGLFGDAWWILVLTSLVGLAFLAGGIVNLFRMLRRGARATDRGYRTATVALVLADRERDAGFLLQGARSYSTMPPRRRARILRVRLLNATLTLAASLWLSVGFVVGVLLATRGAMDAAGLAWWTLGPPGAVILVVVVLRAWMAGHLRRARRKWFKQPWRQDLEEGEIEGWHDDLAHRDGAIPVPSGSEGGGGTGLRIAAGGTLLVGLGLGLVGVVLMGLAAIGPILAEVAVPRFSRTQARAAEARAVADHRLTPDPGITPLMAGEALVALAEVGRAPGDPGDVPDYQRPPVRTYDRPLVPRGDGAENPTGVDPIRWTVELVPRLADGLEPEVLEYLEEVGAHPALAELRTLARAPGLDEAGARFVTPLPEDVTVFTLPIPRLSPVRQATYAHIGGAVAAAADGREDEAVERLREVISAGLLLGEEANSLITNVVGWVIAANGAEALANLYEATGRADAARGLRDEIATAEAAAEMMRVGEARTPSAALAGMPEVVIHPRAIRGLRWELFAMLNGLGPCINLNRSIFGTDEEHAGWMDEARTVLVRHPADEELFELYREGVFEQMGLDQTGVPIRLVSFVLGDPTVGGCAAAFRQAVR